MITEYGIDYGNLTGTQKFEINHKAYIKYYMSCCEKFDNFSSLTLKQEHPLMYNSWYGTESHKKFVIPLLRKIKLDKIKKTDI